MSDLFGNPEDRFSHNTAHFIYRTLVDLASLDMKDIDNGMSMIGFNLGKNLASCHQNNDFPVVHSIICLMGDHA